MDSVLSVYIFTKNLQGDIIGIYDSTGSIVVQYRYNAWGELYSASCYPESEHILEANPFRYRGYYFDQETGLYYLNSRYYDPEIKRFINADSINYLGANGDFTSFNLYAYCSNNPVMYVDPSGNSATAALFAFVLSEKAIEIIVGVVVTLVVVAVAVSVASDPYVQEAVGDAIDYVSNVANHDKNSTHTVYHLEDEFGKVQYVGRTTNPQNRKKAHENDPNRSHLNFVLVEENLTYEEARGLEQSHMMFYHTLNANQKYNNQINGISKSNKKISIYFEAAKNYLNNRTSNEMLCFMEKLGV